MQATVSINGYDHVMSLKDAAALADIMGRALVIDRRYLGHTYNSEDCRHVASTLSVTITTGEPVATMTRAEFDAEDAAFRAAAEAMSAARAAEG